MPYATPISPLSPSANETHAQKGWLTPPTHIEDMVAGPSTATSYAPMPLVPRRSSSSHSHPSSGTTTPRRTVSPAIARHASNGGSSSQSFPASRPMEGLPRRSSSGLGTFGVSGLPSASTIQGEGSLGLKLHPSPPAKAPDMQRGIKDSISSTSTVESSLPPTPDEEPPELPLIPATKSDKGETDGAPTPSIPFPSFEPPVLRSVPPHRTFSQSPPSRPSVMTTRRNSALGHHRGNGPVGGSLQIPIPTSASTSNIPGQPSGVGSPQLLRPIAGMIRKKSGEVVKPSLKVRSMSTPDLSRQPDAEPQTPDFERDRGFPEERSKSVRFADGDDDNPSALESVVLFLREQKPTAVGKAADPDHVGFVTDTETEADDTDASDFVQFRTRRNAAARAADEAGQIVMEGGSRVPRLRVDFAPDARGSLNGENVVLERVELVNGPGPLCMRGTMIVRNVAFQKWVSVRFTLDHWQTTSEVSANHVCHIPSSTTGDEGWDRFGFTVKLEDFKRKIDERQLVMCIRFSVGDQEWWDSNYGMNYNFTFRKGPPRRPTRVSGPASLGTLTTRDDNLPITGLRQRNTSPTQEISRSLGVPLSGNKKTGPRDWVFPKFAAQHINDTTPSRSGSPAPTHSPTAYKVPAPPDVHTHLSLSKTYCAPSPPTSPPKDGQFSLADGASLAMVVSPADLSPEQTKVEMDVMGGQFATLSPPTADAELDRRSSWSGKQNGSWDSFAKVMEKFDEAATPSRESIDGDSTPVAAGSQSPAGKASSSSDSSPERSRPLQFKRSTGDLRALLDSEENTGLFTPPASNLSSPPSPGIPTLPSVPLSPSDSTVSSSLSTGESSPVKSVSSNGDSMTDLANLAIEIDPEERGRSTRPEYKMLNNHSYQDFLDKFCFFTSPRMTPSDEPVYKRPNYIPISGTASPNGFPFFATGSTQASNSPRSTPTPTRQYDSASDAFNFSGATGSNNNTGGPATPRASPPAKSPSFAAGSATPAFSKDQMGRASPSLAAN